MENIVIGALVGALLCLIPGIIFGIMLDNLYCDEKVKRIIITTVMIVTIVALVVGGAIVGYSIGYHESASFIEEYTIMKDTIENSITNETLSGFERAELVKQAAELNSDLVSRQYDCRQWYGFAVPDEILELTPITFGAK